MNILPKIESPGNGSQAPQGSVAAPDRRPISTREQIALAVAVAQREVGTIDSAILTAFLAALAGRS